MPEGKHGQKYSQTFLKIILSIRDTYIQQNVLQTHVRVKRFLYSNILNCDVLKYLSNSVWEGGGLNLSILDGIIVKVCIGDTQPYTVHYTVYYTVYSHPNLSADNHHYQNRVSV